MNSTYLSEILTGYSTALAEYTGSGILTTSDNRQTKCSFEAIQLRDGKIFFVCENLPSDFYPEDVHPVSFQGTTTDGWQFSTAEFGIRLETSWSWRIVFLLNECKITLPNGSAPAEIRFGLSNFRVLGNQLETTAFGGRVLGVNLITPSSHINVRISRVPDYELICRRLSRLKGIDVTSEAIFKISDPNDNESSYEIVDHLCYILSVAAGTKIQWIYATLYDERRAIVQHVHSARVTKPYNSLVLIDAENHRSTEIGAFVENAYPAYVQKREAFKLARGAIDAYLDAKTSGDYLEARGAKLAVCLELLKSILLANPDLPMSRFVVDRETFAILKAKIKDAIGAVLIKEKVNSVLRSKFYSNLLSLNNIPFRELIGNLLTHIGLTTPTSDIELFVACRNKLIHEGTFYCKAATEQEAKRCPPPKSPRLEYAFMVSFLDRIFLKILDYDGPYIDWRSGAPVRKDQL